MTKLIRVIPFISVAALVLTGQGALAQTAVTLPVGANAEPASNTIASGTGFTIVTEDAATATPTQPDVVRQADIALAKTDLRFSFDGLRVERRLDLIVLNDAPVLAGQTVRVQSQMNYPAFAPKGEVRVIDLNASGAPKTLLVVPIDANGTARFAMPEGRNLALVHRVFDARGRYDETAPRLLVATPAAVVFADNTDLAIEQGSTTLARQRIPIFGGAVTVSGDNVPNGAQVRTLGEVITPDPSGSFVVQRILPPGDQPVTVQVTGAGPDTYLERSVNIPKNEWFYTATADLTFGWRLGNATTATGAPLDDTYSFGRLAGYAKGRTSNGWTITASADTGEEELDELFRNFDEKDTYSLLLRAARENAYPTFGDDSSIEDGAPTNGKFYLKAERDGSHLLWGNYKATIDGSKYLRNERQLYGAQGVYRSPEQTEHGDARVALEAYAASPDRLPGREAFRGTGGSIYFLQRQDISVGSETLTVEIRDPDTGRVIERRTLTEGRDYDVNYIQGVITLVAPLTGRTGSSTVVTRPGGEYDVFLVANYEFTPTAGDVDGLSYGGRAEAWVSDNLRVGVTGLVEQTDVADQHAYGADLRYRLGENSFVALEFAQTEGPGFGSTTSSDGGLIIASTTSAGTAGGSGRAVSAEVELDFEELGSTTPGSFSGYYENRTAGFSTLDYQTTDDEELWGVAIYVEPSERVALRFSYDDYSNALGKSLREGEAAISFRPNALSTWELGVAHIDKVTPGGAADETGARTDVALRFTRQQSDDFAWYVFGQTTLQQSGGLDRNDRVGAGAQYRFAKNWTVDGEISYGTSGTAGSALLTYQSDGYEKAYVGYRLEPGRDFSGVSLRGSDQGTWVVGGQRRIKDNVDIYAENTYDLFGEHKSLTSAYGVQYRATEQLTFSGAFEFGRVDDGADDFDRNALSLGVRYSDGDKLTASAKLEFRLDEGTLGGTPRNQRAFLFNAGARYKFDESHRLLFNLEYANTDTDSSSILSGTYSDVTLGYAYRPINNDKLNLLFKYRFLYDMIGQEIDGSATRGPRQESHVVSVDMAYDLNKNWTLGAKLGGRFSMSSPNDTIPLQRNDAVLGVLNARYHLTHKWDVLLEARYLSAIQADLTEAGLLAAAYRHLGNNLKLGVGYNFTDFSDDLTDLTYDDEGVFVNIVAKF